MSICCGRPFFAVAGVVRSTSLWLPFSLTASTRSHSLLREIRSILSIFSLVQVLPYTHQFENETAVTGAAASGLYFFHGPGSARTSQVQVSSCIVLLLLLCPFIPFAETHHSVSTFAAPSITSCPLVAGKALQQAQNAVAIARFAPAAPASRRFLTESLPATATTPAPSAAVSSCCSSQPSSIWRLLSKQNYFTTLQSASTPTNTLATATVAAESLGNAFVEALLQFARESSRREATYYYRIPLLQRYLYASTTAQTREQQPHTFVSAAVETARCSALPPPKRQLQQRHQRLQLRYIGLSRADFSLSRYISKCCCADLVEVKNNHGLVPPVDSVSAAGETAAEVALRYKKCKSIRLSVASTRCFLRSSNWLASVFYSRICSRSSRNSVGQTTRCLTYIERENNVICCSRISLNSNKSIYSGKMTRRRACCLNKSVRCGFPFLLRSFSSNHSESSSSNRERVGSYTRSPQHVSAFCNRVSNCTRGVKKRRSFTPHLHPIVIQPRHLRVLTHWSSSEWLVQGLLQQTHHTTAYAAGLATTFSATAHLAASSVEAGFADVKSGAACDSSVATWYSFTNRITGKGAVAAAAAVDSGCNTHGQQLLWRDSPADEGLQKKSTAVDAHKKRKHQKILSQQQQSTAQEQQQQAFSRELTSRRTGFSRKFLRRGGEQQLQAEKEQDSGDAAEQQQESFYEELLELERVRDQELLMSWGAWSRAVGRSVEELQQLVRKAHGLPSAAAAFKGDATAAGADVIDKACEERSTFTPATAEDADVRVAVWSAASAKEEQFGHERQQRQRQLTSGVETAPSESELHVHGEGYRGFVESCHSVGTKCVQTAVARETLETVDCTSRALLPSSAKRAAKSAAAATREALKGEETTIVRKELVPFSHGGIDGVAADSQRGQQDTAKDLGAASAQIRSVSEYEQQQLLRKGRRQFWRPQPAAASAEQQTADHEHLCSSHTSSQEVRSCSRSMNQESEQHCRLLQMPLQHEMESFLTSRARDAAAAGRDAGASAPLDGAAAGVSKANVLRQIAAAAAQIKGPQLQSIVERDVVGRHRSLGGTKRSVVPSTTAPDGNAKGKAEGRKSLYRRNKPVDGFETKATGVASIPGKKGGTTSLLLTPEEYKELLAHLRVEAVHAALEGSVAEEEVPWDSLQSTADVKKAAALRTAGTTPASCQLPRKHVLKSADSSEGILRDAPDPAATNITQVGATIAAAGTGNAVEQRKRGVRPPTVAEWAAAATGGDVAALGRHLHSGRQLLDDCLHRMQPLARAAVLRFRAANRIAAMMRQQLREQGDYEALKALITKGTEEELELLLVALQGIRQGLRKHARMVLRRIVRLRKVQQKQEEAAVAAARAAVAARAPAAKTQKGGVRGVTPQRCRSDSENGTTAICSQSAAMLSRRGSSTGMKHAFTEEETTNLSLGDEKDLFAAAEAKKSSLENGWNVEEPATTVAFLLNEKSSKALSLDEGWTIAARKKKAGDVAVEEPEPVATAAEEKDAPALVERHKTATRAASEEEADEAAAAQEKRDAAIGAAIETAEAIAAAKEEPPPSIAYWTWMRAAMMEWEQQKRQVSEFPWRWWSEAAKGRKAAHALYQQLGREPTEIEVAEKIGVTPARWRDITLATKSAVSTEAEVAAGGLRHGRGGGMSITETGDRRDTVGDFLLSSDMGQDGEQAALHEDLETQVLDLAAQALHPSEYSLLETLIVGEQGQKIFRSSQNQMNENILGKALAKASSKSLVSTPGSSISVVKSGRFAERKSHGNPISNDTERETATENELGKRGLAHENNNCKEQREGEDEDERERKERRSKNEDSYELPDAVGAADKSAGCKKKDISTDSDMEEEHFSKRRVLLDFLNDRVSAKLQGAITKMKEFEVQRILESLSPEERADGLRNPQALEAVVQRKSAVLQLCLAASTQLGID